MGLATTGGAEVEGESQVKKSRRAIGTGGRLAGLRLRLRLRLAGWLAFTNYQLPNGPVKAGRQWGQRHPQGANLGSNGILNFLSKLKQWLPPAHPKSLASQCMSGQPISTCHALTS